MGELKVSVLNRKKHQQRFVKSLLEDVKALKQMLDNDYFETGITRIGAEQEMVLVDTTNYKPMLNAMELLDKMKKHPWVVTELAKFNLEINLDPYQLKGKCFTSTENDILKRLKKIQDKLTKMDTQICLTGILPTLTKMDLKIQNLTPKPRYYALMESINNQLRKSSYELRIDGIDELYIEHDSPLMEACNTSFQVHLQVDPDDFVDYYNMAQTLAGPMLAIAANSPMVFGRRLWHESRIAMFQQAIDTRKTHEHMRDTSPRVHFGNDWIHDSILDIYKEDITLFRPLLSPDISENSLDVIKEGAVPKLRALQAHNSTIYRWNRPCYGISDNGKPHLRIENRVFPAGPTVADEVANACFWIGAMKGMKAKYGDVRQHIDFDDVRDNFFKGAKFGIDTTFSWLDGKKITACQLVLKELLPLAEEGLKAYKVNADDIKKYLGIIKARAKKHVNGALWQLRSHSQLRSQTATRGETLTVLTHAIVENQKKNVPVHKWKLPDVTDLKEYKPSEAKVTEFMDTHLLTVQKDDTLELAIAFIEWRQARYLPVEDKHGKLIGLLSSEEILKFLASNKRDSAKTVGDLMIKNPVTVDPETTLREAMKAIEQNKVGCLPVVSKGDLIGVITENHFINISNRLMERLKTERKNK